MSVARTPSRVGLALTGLASLLAAVGAGLGGSPIGLVGVPIAVVGVYRTARWVLAAGVTALFVGVAFAGLSGADPGVVLLAMLGTVLAWDVGENAISLAGHLRTGTGHRTEVVHAATSAIVASAFSVGAYVVYLYARGGEGGVALSLLVFGTVVVLLVLGD